MSDVFSFGQVFLRLNSTPPTLEMHRQAKLREYGLSKILGLTEIRIPSDSVVSNAIANYCVLYWCVNTYSAAVRMHKLNETVLDSWHDPNPPLDGAGPETQFYLQPPEKDDLTQHAFIVNIEVSREIGYWLESKMITSNLLLTTCYGDTAGMNGPMRDSSEFIQPMLRRNLTDVFRSLANGVTTRVRQLDWSAQNYTGRSSHAEGIGAANGTSFMMETQIDVRWAWIVLPSLLLVITMLFTGVTIRKTKRMGLEAWKSSPTALICSGLDEDIQQEIRAAKNPIDMENLTADIPVHLRQCNTDAHGDYWKLVTS